MAASPRRPCPATRLRRAAATATAAASLAAAAARAAARAAGATPRPAALLGLDSNPSNPLVRLRLRLSPGVFAR
jgi:hypothetical protein